MSIPFIHAVNYTRGRGRSTITALCIHDMEAPETARTAENVAAWFASKDAPKASAHYCIDSDSIVQCVRDEDAAWHAGPANGWSIGIEHAGYAKQTAEEWADPFSVAMLERSAGLCARLCAQWKIPIKHLDGDALARGERAGICGHADVTAGLTGGKGHTDPGAHFPWEWFLERVRARLASLGAETEPAPALEEELPDTQMPLEKAQEILARLGYDPGPADGRDGPRTRAAVAAFQLAQNMTADGVVGPRTSAALREAAAAAQPSPPSSDDGEPPPPTESTVVLPTAEAAMPDDFVEVEHAGTTWLVSRTVVGFVAIGEAADVARRLGYELPTPALSDAIWRAADLRIDPSTVIQHHDGTAAGMNAPQVYAAVLSAIAEAVAAQPDYRLLAGAFKDVVYINGRLGLYGWHADEAAAARLAHKSIPTHAPATLGEGVVVQQPYGGHAAAWVDYSQGLRLVRRKP